MAESVDHILLCECKWTNEPVGVGVLSILEQKSKSLPDHRAKKYALFSKSGYTRDLAALSHVRQDLMLFSAKDLFD